MGKIARAAIVLWAALLTFNSSQAQDATNYDQLMQEMGLIDIALLRSKAAKAKIYEITANGNTAFLHINSIESEVMSKISAHFGNRFLLKMADKPVYTVKLNKNQKLSDFINELSAAL